MKNVEKNFNIREYLEIALRRKWYILIPLVISILFSFPVYKRLPKIYKATTLILVQPQKVPEAYVRSIITAPITERLNTISQEILSRTSLEKVIKEFDVFPNIRNEVPMEVIIEQMRKMIDIRVQSRGATQSTFSISFEGEDPAKVMKVANNLASLFIEENLKVRELQAEKTAEFITKELYATEGQLKRKEEDLRKYKEKYMGQLPQQLDANLRILERLQQQLKTTSDNIRAVEDRSILLQDQIERLRSSELPRISEGVRREGNSDKEEIREGRVSEDPLITQWNNLRKDLDIALSKYTENHPDVIDLRRKIALLEPKVKEILKKQEAARETQHRELMARMARNREENIPTPTLGRDPAVTRLLSQYMEQYRAAQIEVKRFKDEVQLLQDTISLYQKRVEDTPRREQEMVLLTRDYDLMKTSYQSLLEKKMQAQMAENLERKQQGEQFKVLDPARLPEKPIRPDPFKILLICSFIGLTAGLGLAWLKETADQSFHSETELEADLGFPILVIIPNLEKEKNIFLKE